MIRLVRKIIKDRRGNVLAIVAGAMPLLIGSAGLATDTIQWALWKRQLQRAADSAAIAGVYQKVQSSSQSSVSAAVNKDLSINHHTKIPLLAGYPQVTMLGDSGTMRDRVQVGLAIQKKLSFSSFFMSSPPVIRATATAATVPGSDEYCVIATEPSASKTGITIGGNTAIEMDCGFISNSPAANSALSNGNSSSVTASVIAAVGGVEKSNNWNVAKYDPYTTPVKDPYANVNTDPTQFNCASNPPALTDSTPNASSLNGGCFSSLSVGSNRTLTLGPGTYYISGQNANTAGNVNVQGRLTCNGCTIVLTNKDPSATAKIGTFNMNAQAVMTLSAPTSGPYQGIAVFQDRRATDSGGSSQNKFNGGGTGIITGALYFPNQEVTYNGNGTSSAICTRFVTRRIIFSGNSTTSNKFLKGSSCPLFGNTGVGGGRRVRLVA